MYADLKSVVLRTRFCWRQNDWPLDAGNGAILARGERKINSCFVFYASEAKIAGCIM